VLADPHRPKLYTEEQYLKTEEEMRALFADIPQAIDNTVVIAQRCNLDGVLQKPQLPLFPTPEGVSLDEYMVQLA
jgi:DNA polymerase-3 subunit alpha